MVTTGDGIPQNPVDVTLSGATAANYNGTGYKTYWLAYGIQQWGTWKAGDSAWHPFPISFSKACYQIVCAININDSSNMSKNRVFVSSYDNNGFNIAAYGQGIRMIAIGV